jgi:hypothetical protein
MFFLLIPVVLSLDPSKVKFAVNCGGPDYRSPDGVLYQSDTGYSTGITSEHGKSSPIRLTTTQDLYQTERYATSDLSYTIPVSESGSYVLILKFSEVWFNSEQQKMFHINLGDLRVVEFLDIFSKVGIFAAYDEFIEFSFENGKIFVNGEEAKNAVKNGKLKVTFVKTDFDNPKINAIALVKGKIEDTNFSQQKKSLDGMRKASEEELRRYDTKKQVKVHENEDDFEDFEDPAARTIVLEENHSLLGLLGTVPALVLIALVLVLSVAACLPTGKPASVQIEEPKPKGREKKKN